MGWECGGVGERVRACSDWSSHGVSLYFIFFLKVSIPTSYPTRDAVMFVSTVLLHYIQT